MQFQEALPPKKLPYSGKTSQKPQKQNLVISNGCNNGEMEENFLNSKRKFDDTSSVSGVDNYEPSKRPKNIDPIHHNSANRGNEIEMEDTISITEEENLNNS
jgi:hypothetical protein